MVTPNTFKQFALFKSPDLLHGGDLRRGKRKIRRPLDPKRAIHLVLKSEHAQGPQSLLQPRHAKRIETLIEHTSRQYGIKVYRYANVGNHLHLLIKINTRENFQNFLRIISGKIAILVTQAKKGQKKGKFWDALSFTRVVNWGRDFNQITIYFVKNQIESFGYGTEIARRLIRQGYLTFKTAAG